MALGSIHGTSSACGLSLLLALSVLAGDEGFLCEYSTSAAKTKSLTFTQELSTYSSPLGVIFFRDLAKKGEKQGGHAYTSPIAWSSRTHITWEGQTAVHGCPNACFRRWPNHDVGACKCVSTVLLFIYYYEKKDY